MIEFSPLIVALSANITAQIVKPIFHYRFHKEWDIDIIFDSGGFPSSHTATVVALASSIGIIEGLSSSIFAVAFAFALIVCYDAANVRYYAGQNIKITQQLIKDIQDLTHTKLTDPIYLTRVKNVLGHKWIEVIGGFIWGLANVAIWYYLTL